MKKQVLAVLYLLATYAAAQAQDSLAFRTYTMNGGSREFGICAMRISDTRSVLFNITSNCMTATCNHGMALTLIDNNGKMLRYKKIGADVIDVDPDKAIYTSDGHILMVGSYGTPKRMVMKLDTFFNILWTTVIEQKPGNIYTGPFIECLAELNHSYYMTFSNEITRLTETGDVVYSKYYGPAEGNTSPYMYVNYKSIVPLSDNRFFVAGEVDDSGAVNERSFIGITDTNGNIIRQAKFDIGAPYGSDVSHSFAESANKIKLFGHYNNDVFTANADTNLVVTGLKKYTGTPMYTHDVIFNGTDRYFVSAYDNTSSKISVFAIDNDGTLQWSKFLNNGNGFFQTTNHMINSCTFGIYSSTPIASSLAHKGFWAKLNSDGTTSSAIAESALTLTTSSTLPLSIINSSVVDSGQWQTAFNPQTFITDGTIVADSTWFMATNPVVCTPTTTGIVSPAILIKDLCVPNPFTGYLQISNDWDLSEISSLTLLDATGRIIYTGIVPDSRAIFLPGIKGMVFARWISKGVYYNQKLMAL